MKRLRIALVAALLLCAAQPALAYPGFSSEDELAAMRDKIWIVYFYRDGCNWCEKQKAELESFRQKWGWTQIMAINAGTERKLAGQFQVRGVPDVWLVSTAGEVPKRRRISVGLITEPTLVPYVRETYSAWFEQR